MRCHQCKKLMEKKEYRMEISKADSFFDQMSFDICKKCAKDLMVKKA